jgi:hypothetical protein
MNSASRDHMAKRPRYAHPESPRSPSGANAFVQPAVYALVLLATLLIPLKIVGQGFMPDDDALADAAKALVDRPWTDILVLRPEYALDPHGGWHFVLHIIAAIMGWGGPALVGFAVVSLFVAVVWSAVPWLERPEAWLCALIVIVGAGTGLIERYTRGRPFIVSATVLSTILWLWQRNGSAAPSRRVVGFMTALIAVAVLLHGSWYLWALPVAAFYLARQDRWARSLIIAWIAGTVIGSVLTGHPIGYFVESARMGIDAVIHPVFQRTLVAEFQPTQANFVGLFLIGSLLVFRQLTCGDTLGLFANPAFCLACLGWVLGYKATRFWGDWGIIGLAVVWAAELQRIIVERIPADGLARIGLTAAAAGTLYLLSTNDAGSRWTSNVGISYGAPAAAVDSGWLPAPGGILYAAEMEVFYRTFFGSPEAPWKYVTGFEPAMMPSDDYATYQSIVLNHGNPLAYAPWVRKLRPQDRIALHWSGLPPLPSLDWKLMNGLWYGRPRA